jgi:hypothetical protein
MSVVPCETNMLTTIRMKDNQFIKIQELIEAKEQLLMHKQKKIRSNLNKNNFLEVVKEDYSKYNNYIIQQKRDQVKSLEILDKYIKDLTISGQLTKHNIEDSKEEQHKILREIKSIKANLDFIINDTKDIVAKTII